MTFNNYLLCTDGDLFRHLFVMLTMDTDYSRREAEKVKAELERRENLRLNRIVGDFRKKSKLSS